MSKQDSFSQVSKSLAKQMLQLLGISLIDSFPFIQLAKRDMSCRVGLRMKKDFCTSGCYPSSWATTRSLAKDIAAADAFVSLSAPNDSIFMPNELKSFSNAGKVLASNPYYGCRSVPEIMIKMDLLDGLREPGQLDEGISRS